MYQNNPLLRLDDKYKREGKKIVDIKKEDKGAFGTKIISKKTSVDALLRDIPVNSKITKESGLNRSMHTSGKREIEGYLDNKITNKTLPTSPVKPKKNDITVNRTTKNSPRTLRFENKNKSSSSIGVKTALTTKKKIVKNTKIKVK